MSITTVGIIGAGTMGNGIAQVCAVSGIHVVMVDISDAAVAKGIANVSGSLDRLVKKEKITATDKDAALARILGSTRYEDLKPAQLVIEAATENFDLKVKILKQIDAVVAPEVIVTSNTSSISITKLADADANRTDGESDFTQFAPATILVADDSAVAHSAIELGFKAMGVPVVMTKNGKEAWERLQAMHDAAAAQGKSAKDLVAVVVTDLEMPEMDGVTLTRLIKQDPRFKNIPVVIHSSLTGATNEAHIKSVGADAYVAKSAPRELAATIRSVLKTYSPWQP